LTQLIAHDKEVYDVAWSPSSRDVFASVGADGSVRMFDLRSLEHSTILYEKNVVNGSSNSKTASSKSNPSTDAPPSPVGTPNLQNANNLPLLRLAYNPYKPDLLSVFHANSNTVQILDVRYPGAPKFEVKGHKGNINGMAWLPSESGGGGGESLSSYKDGVLATCCEHFYRLLKMCTLIFIHIAEDHQLLLWSPTVPANSSSSKKSAHGQTVSIRDPFMAYTAPSECNFVTWSSGNRDWIAIGMGKTVRCLRAW
jgi:DDB1- and CUL4-associated factor 7